MVRTASDRLGRRTDTGTALLPRISPRSAGHFPGWLLGPAIGARPASAPVGARLRLSQTRRTTSEIARTRAGLVRVGGGGTLLRMPHGPLPVAANRGVVVRVRAGNWVARRCVAAPAAGCAVFHAEPF